MTDAQALQHYKVPKGHKLYKHATKVDATGGPLFSVEAASRQAILEQFGFSVIDELPAVPKEATKVVEKEAAPVKKRGRKAKTSNDA